VATSQRILTWILPIRIWWYKFMLKIHFVRVDLTYILNDEKPKAKYLLYFAPTWCIGKKGKKTLITYFLFLAANKIDPLTQWIYKVNALSSNFNRIWFQNIPEGDMCMCVCLNFINNILNTITSRKIIQNL